MPDQLIATLDLPDGRKFNVAFVAHRDGPLRLGESSGYYSTIYSWTKGNMDCDCNKAILLNEQHDLELPEECGDTIILRRLTIDGETIYEAN